MSQNPMTAQQIQAQQLHLQQMQLQQQAQAQAQQQAAAAQAAKQAQVAAVQAAAQAQAQAQLAAQVQAAQQAAAAQQQVHQAVQQAEMKRGAEAKKRKRPEGGDDDDYSSGDEDGDDVNVRPGGMGSAQPAAKVQKTQKSGAKLLKNVRKTLNTLWNEANLGLGSRVPYSKGIGGLINCGIRLIGWPAGVPFTGLDELSQTECKRISVALANNQIQFKREQASRLSAQALLSLFLKDLETSLKADLNQFGGIDVDRKAQIDADLKLVDLLLSLVNTPNIVQLLMNAGSGLSSASSTPQSLPPPRPVGSVGHGPPHSKATVDQALKIVQDQLAFFQQKM